MTREILFRGKRTDNGEWVEGHYSPVNIPITGNMGHFINVGGYRAVEIDPETVGQFTGLCDKNGVRIFEGDIIRWHDNTELSVGGQIAEVCFGKYRDADSAFDDVYAIGFYLRTSGGECVTICWLDEYKNDFDIIGNIHDTPELLEVSGDEP